MIKRTFAVLATAVAASTFVYGQTDTLALGEIVVTGTRNATDVRHLPMTVSVVGRERLTAAEQPSILPTISQQVPGLFVTSRGVLGYGVSGGAAGGINMRGISGGAGQLLVLIDGHPQYNGVYGHPISDAYQTLMADRVEVLHGPASVLYGSNAMGGVINIVTRGMHRNGVSTHLNVGAGSWGTVQTELSNQLRSGRFSSTIALQYNRSDNHRPRMGFEQYGGYVKLGYDISANWNAYVDANITRFNASYPDSVQRPRWSADQWITRGNVSAGIENHYGHTSGALTVYTNFGRHKIDDGTTDPAAPTTQYFRSKDALTGVSLYQSINLFEGNRLTVGLDYQHIYGRAYYTSKETGEVLHLPYMTDRKLVGASYRNEIAGYVDFRQDVTPWLTVDAGLRLDHHSVTGSEWVPQLGVVVRPTPTGELKAMASKGYRNPTMRELYLYPPSNEDLEPERLWNYELSWRQRLCRLTYGINLFYINGDNLIQTQMVEGAPRNVNTGRVENYGLELNGVYTVGQHWTLNTNHSLLQMKNELAAAPKYKGYVGADYRCCGWTVGAGLQYLSGLRQDWDGDGITDVTQRDFCLLSANVSYRVSPLVRLWLRGENLLAQRYEINYGYPMPRATVMAGVHLSF
ncbi:MAG: TonB-dependent receptor [Prevotella sp.]|nr:TonB-dependent receptor [Prevotella sp.]